MPIYEYRCANCGFQKEALQKLSDPPLKDCPECGKPALAKMVTAAGFQLKGSGWYVTDFRNKPQDKAQTLGGKSAKTGEGAAANAEPAKSAAPEKASTDAAGSTAVPSSAAKPAPSSDNK